MSSIPGYSENPCPTPCDHASPKLGTQPPLPSQNLHSKQRAKRCQTQRWCALTAYGNIPSPYQSTAPRAPHPQKGIYAVKEN